MAHNEPFAFSKLMRYSDNAFRFLNGTPAIPALYAAGEGPKIISKVGVSKIRAKSKHQTSLLIEKARSYDFPVVTPADPEHRGGTVSIKVPHAYEVSRELLRCNIIVDFRKGSGIRLAPHFYNTDEEVISRSIK
jgi:kynureninase